MGKVLDVGLWNGSSKADLCVAFGFSERPPELSGLPGALASALRAAAKRSAWSGESGRVLRAESAAAGRGLVLGAGPRERFETATLDRLLARAVGEARESGAADLVVSLPRHAATRGTGRALGILQRLAGKGYSFDEFRSQASRYRLRRVRVLPPASATSDYRRARRFAAAAAAGATLTRDLANTPPNRANPAWMAARARALARRHGMKARVLGPPELRRKGMGGLLAVGGGSASSPRLVRLEWGRGDLTLALVGKGVTFDTGGISIKPSAAMDEMKYDKCGACTVLGVAEAVAALELPVRLRVYLPLAENMPDGRSYRPGDIVRCYNGKTVEVLNTDAEGRMVLADALAWAVEEEPDVLLEYSTLTGATVVALGHHGAALYSPDDRLSGELATAAAESGERLWRMPLWPEFRRELEGTHGDLRNVAGRWGGANHAAAFLAEFLGDHPSWGHLDIAGTAWIGADGGEPRGATGYGVGLTLQWLLGRIGRL